MLRTTQCLAFVVLSLCVLHVGYAQDSEIDIDGCKLSVLDNGLVFQPEANSSPKSIKVRRFFNTIRSITLIEGSKRTEVPCQPEIDHWILALPDREIDWKRASVFMELSPPVNLSARELSNQADGSFSLNAYDALTKGSKLRFEPQPFKNTVGYWVDPNDFCWWTINVDKPGKFNLEILQGCGGGQGGSSMEVKIYQAKDTMAATEDAILSVPFDVLETGHFQNFQARHLGEVNIAEAGKYRVAISVKKIAKNAAMDVRRLDLIRLP